MLVCVLAQGIVLIWLLTASGWEENWIYLTPDPAMSIAAP